MYGIFTYNYHKNRPNVGKYTIHGSYGLGCQRYWNPRNARPSPLLWRPGGLEGSPSGILSAKIWRAKKISMWVGFPSNQGFSYSKWSFWGVKWRYHHLRKHPCIFGGNEMEIHFLNLPSQEIPPKNWSGQFTRNPYALEDWRLVHPQPSPMKRKENDLNQTSRELCSSRSSSGVYGFQIGTVSLLETPLSGAIAPYITGRGPLCRWLQWVFFCIWTTTFPILEIYVLLFLPSTDSIFSIPWNGIYQVMLNGWFGARWFGMVRIFGIPFSKGLLLRGIPIRIPSYRAPNHQFSMRWRKHRPKTKASSSHRHFFRCFTCYLGKLSNLFCCLANPSNLPPFIWSALPATKMDITNDTCWNLQQLNMGQNCTPKRKGKFSSGHVLSVFRCEHVNFSATWSTGNYIPHQDYPHSSSQVLSTKKKTTNGKVVGWGPVVLSSNPFY